MVSSLNFERGQLDLAARHPSAVRLSDRCAVRRIRKCLAADGLGLAPAQDRLHAQNQLTHGKRFDHIVIRAELEADDAIDLFAFRGQHHHRHALALALHRLAHLGKPEDVGQHQDRAAPTAAVCSRNERRPSLAEGRRLRVEARLGEGCAFQHLAEIGFVFDDQQAFHTCSFA